MSLPHDPKTSAGRAMHLCARCDGELVQPVAWTEDEANTWQVELRCPECEWSATSVFGQREIDDYDRRLDEGARSLIEDLRHLTHENMEAELADFASALEADLILPEDF